MTTGPDPKIVYAYKSADPVEGLSFHIIFKNGRRRIDANA